MLKTTIHQFLNLCITPKYNIPLPWYADAFNAMGKIGHITNLPSKLNLEKTFANSFF
jgi:hypothetical protein